MNSAAYDKLYFNDLFGLGFGNEYDTIRYDTIR